MIELAKQAEADQAANVAALRAFGHQREEGDMYGLVHPIVASEIVKIHQRKRLKDAETWRLLRKGTSGRSGARGRILDGLRAGLGHFLISGGLRLSRKRRLETYCGEDVEALCTDHSLRPRDPRVHSCQGTLC